MKTPEELTAQNQKLKEGTTMKTPEELQELKDEVDVLAKKLLELTDEELKQVTGGFGKRLVGK